MRNLEFYFLCEFENLIFFSSFYQGQDTFNFLYCSQLKILVNSESVLASAFTPKKITKNEGQTLPI